MNRRSFLTKWFARPTANANGSNFPTVRPQSSGLEAYVPDATKPWNAIRAGHLLRRATFLPRWADINAILQLSPSQAVDLLLDTPSAPERPGMADSVTESLEGLDITLRNQVIGVWKGDVNALRAWYVAAMKAANLSIVEKMTLFWNGHFTSEFETDDSYVIAPLLYRQNQLLRDRCLGNFKDLVFSVTLDGGMLVYLGGELNKAGAPNENYARELLELFTTGLGHYTEGDVQNAARILTGWRVAQFNDKPAPNGIFKTYFKPNEHDINAKEFLGVSFPARDITTNTEFIVQQEEVRRLTDTIFEKRGQAVAKFICRKLYRYFVYSSPVASDEAVINAMADLFIASNFDIKPVMSALLKSAHFFDNANIGAQIKTPAELEVGLARQLDLSADLASQMRRLDQDLFEPPNVSGWTGYRDWITTTTYPIRSDHSHAAVNAMSDDAVLAFIRSFPDFTDVAKLTAGVAAVVLPRALSTERLASLKGKLVGSAPDYEWPEILSDSPATAARNMREMLTTIVDLPDFQLC